ncbi:barstar family protein [Streptomyces sp. MUM 178J]|uniref:barstar family protein n=1 Tax=Streptomyces sp. MUM 178J TaxID=2791991 RepID=UPI001F043F9D|nr:barstar family protein [Streptomyces sp. MUM 178J]WRQ81123.1 barstar family protein [Streptomyces sp. MUM 178J]
MKEEALASHIAPWMHVITAGGGVPLNELLPVSGSVYVARLNGQDMPDEMSALQQFWEVLKFPEYFGWNWHALYDCLRDLEWLSSDHHVLIIESVEMALSEDEVAREEFFRSLWRAGQRWSYVKRPEGVTLSKLSIVLSCDEESASSLARRLRGFQGQSNF